MHVTEIPISKISHPRRKPKKFYSLDDQTIKLSSETPAGLINHETAVFTLTQEKWDRLENKDYYLQKNLVRGYSVPEYSKNDLLFSTIRDIQYRINNFNINILYYKGKLDKMNIPIHEKWIPNEIIKYSLTGIFS